MNIRDDDSSTDEDMPLPRLGGSLITPHSTGEAGPSSTNLHTGLHTGLPSIGDSDAAAAADRNSTGGFSAYESARSSLFAAPSIAVEHPPTPPSPSPRPTYAAQPVFTTQPPRSIFLDSSSTSLMGDTTVTAAQKEGDDPSAPVMDDSPPGRHSTPTALTRLLASRAATSPTPTASRNASYIDGNVNLMQRINTSGANSLHSHLYSRGLLEGAHSDIAVIAFGHRYNLHRLILDRAPFFATALSGPWIESHSREVVLHPEEVDPTITQKAFELALRRLYGCDISDEEDAEAVGLFATGCWLEMTDVVDSAVESILRQMSAETLAPLIRLVTNNYYGRAGDRILASAKAMLCRDGWEMALKYWDEVPGEIVREIVGGDGFYVPGEWERWVLAKRLLDRRLRQKAAEYNLPVPSSWSTASGGVSQAPKLLTRHSGHLRSASSETASIGGEDVWMAIYADPDIEPILVLMDCGIHYVHLDFERLQYMRQARDVFGLAVLPEHVVTNALWLQMELRQRVVNARESDLELGLSQAAEPPSPPDAVRPSSMPNTAAPAPIPIDQSTGKGKQREPEPTPTDNDLAEEEEKPRKFWIPSADCNIVMGGSSEPVITTNPSSNSFLRLSSGLPTGIDAADVLWASNFAGPSPSRSRGGSRVAEEASTAQPRPVAYSNIPPFRFAAEFPNPKSLKEKKRVYSRTVFYAGSHWNIYIQKVRSQKNPQLGVYLHRAKERDDLESAPQPAPASSVDERIGLLEREMLLRSDGRRAMGRRSMPIRAGDRGDDGSMAAYRRRVYSGAGSGVGVGENTSFTAFDSESDSEEEGADGPLHDERTNFLDETTRVPTPSSSSGPSLTHFPPPSPSQARPRSLPSTTAAASPRPPSAFTAKRTPTLPSYTDARPTIKTYFKIYSPSKGGRLLSVYESAPDNFDFSQSWGWKSSTLMLDEGFSSGGSGNMGIGGDGDGEGGGLAEEVERERERRRRKEGSLRFMVVIGNL